MGMYCHLIRGRRTQLNHVRSATLNPEQQPFCLDTTRTSISLPIQVNQTNPILIELLRFDLDLSRNETLTISSSAVKKLRKDADKAHKSGNPNDPLVLHYPVKKTGIYLLQRILDESKLEVQKTVSKAVVVACPKARINPPGPDRCKGQLSNVALEVEGVPPLKLKYRKIVNGVEREATFQSIQPHDVPSPADNLRDALVVFSNPIDGLRATSERIVVPLNESLSTCGKWTYSVEEVRDSYGNFVKYGPGHAQSEHPKQKPGPQEQTFIVHDRPQVQFSKCDSQHPIRVAKDQPIQLPLHITSSDSWQQPAYPLNINLTFTPEQDMLPNGEPSKPATTIGLEIKDALTGPVVQDNGLYTLKTISSPYCEGQILEPSSCPLQHSPQPELSLSTEEIFDKCAGNPIGLRVAMELIGTPPFNIVYTLQKKGDGHHRIQHETLNELRGQIELTPPQAGHYTYTFTEISDSIYKGHSLKDKNLIIQQDVKPAASAHFMEFRERAACIDESVSFAVELQGQKPWTLEYELVHGGKRTKHKQQYDDRGVIEVVTDKLKSGGTYIIALVSITDGIGCKELLNEQRVINVRRQRPKAAFGQIDGSRSIRTLEGREVQLPLRLSGESPWKIRYQNTDKPSAQPRDKNTDGANDVIRVKEAGTYEILSVHDDGCPGLVEESASTFSVGWIPRPELDVAESSLIEVIGSKLNKRGVCEEDEDSLDLILRGKKPYGIHEQS